MLQLKETNHRYYCSDSNYYTNNGSGRYDTWGDFRDEWLDNGNIDDDYNHLFRFDIKQKINEDDEPIEGKFELYLYFMLQRKGIFVPVCIEDLMQSDMEEVNKFLRDRWDYLQNQWSEFSQSE